MTSRLRLLPALLPGLLLSSVAWATTPASGTLNSTDSTSLEADGGPYVVQNPAGDCSIAAEACDSYALTVDLPANYATTNPGATIVIELVPGTPATDLDLAVLDGEGAAAGNSGNPPGATEVVSIPAGAGMQQFTVQIIPFAAPGGTGKLTIKLVNGPADPCAQSGTETTGGARLAPDIAKAFRELPGSTVQGAFVHFSKGTGKEHKALIERMGLTYVKSFERYASSVFVRGPLSALQRIAKDRSVSYIENNRPLRFHADTDVWASRARVAQEPVSGGPYYAPDGKVLDGTGVTVSVVDSGLFGAHPDFAGRILHNYKIAGNDAAAASPPVDVGYTNSDTTGGHGTHCNGIAVGGGQFSDGGYPVAEASPVIPGTYTGVAPKAKLWAYGTGETLAVFTPDAAFQHILDTYPNPGDANYGDRIRVISNSYGATGGTAFNPADTTSCLVRALIDKGVAIVYSASNDGGDGTDDRTSPTCKDPTPGVICVASYNDSGMGGRNRPLSGFSSRGKRGDPATYPDIAAPGDLITATCAQPVPGQAVCATGAETKWQPYYGTISGTSMSTPHVAGVLALMFQAKPDLTPAAAEKVIQDTARKVSFGYEPDPQNPGGSIHFGYGAGLIDVPAILDALGVRKAGVSGAGLETTVIDGDAETIPTADAAADAVKLTLQELTVGGKPGVVYRITVADASADGFAAAGAVTYEVQQNVGGMRFAPRVTLTPDGKLVDGGGTPAASEMSVDGNTLNFFVPYEQLGYPLALEPITNLRVATFDDSGNAADLAPSTDVPINVAATQPMWGRPFTVQGSAGPAPVTEFSCKLPGITTITDRRGDATGGAPGADILKVQMAEPSDMPGKLVFTMTMANVATLTPNAIYAVRFFPPKEPATVAENSIDPSYFMGLSTFGGSNRFVYGRASSVDGQQTTVLTYAIDGDLDAASKVDAATGTITLVADKALFGDLQPGDDLVQLSASVRVIANDEGPIVPRQALDTIEGDAYYISGDQCLDASGPTLGGSSGGGSGGGSTPGLDSGRFGGAAGWLLVLPGLAFALLRRRRK